MCEATTQLLALDSFHTPSSWRGCLLSELATGSLYVVESFNGDSLVFSGDYKKFNVIYIIYIKAKMTSGGGQMCNYLNWHTPFRIASGRPNFCRYYSIIMTSKGCCRLFWIPQSVIWGECCRKNFIYTMPRNLNIYPISLLLIKMYYFVSTFIDSSGA